MCNKSVKGTNFKYFSGNLNKNSASKLSSMSIILSKMDYSANEETNTMCSLDIRLTIT